MKLRKEVKLREGKSTTRKPTKKELALAKKLKEKDNE